MSKSAESSVIGAAGRHRAEEPSCDRCLPAGCQGYAGAIWESEVTLGSFIGPESWCLGPDVFSRCQLR